MSEQIRAQYPTEAAEFYDKPREACGVFGIYAPDGDVDVAQSTCLGLEELQHRGQDAAGIVINGVRGLIGSKDTGLVTEVFSDGARTLDLIEPAATIGIGHVRYGTVNSHDAFESSQPLLAQQSKLALAHNGHISNIDEVAERYGLVTDTFVSDSQLLVQLIDELTIAGGNVDQVLDQLLPHLEGAFSLVLTDGERLIGVRDPNGFRPLSIGKRIDDSGYVLASETAALKTAGATFLREVEAGEIVVIDQQGITSRSIDKPVEKKGCAFEYVYFARPDSIVEGRSVFRAREHMGRNLADEAPAEADIVIDVPASGTSAAMGYAKQLDAPYEVGLFRNSYINRTFLRSTQLSREQSVRLKLRPNEAVIEGKRLVVVDDSIVRGTTMRTVISLLREAGATEVHLRIPCPPYRWPCFYGMDTGRPEELLAHNRTEDEMREYLGADSLRFLSTTGFEGAISLPLGALCMACLDGNYPTPLAKVSLASAHGAK